MSRTDKIAAVVACLLLGIGVLYAISTWSGETCIRISDESRTFCIAELD